MNRLSICAITLAVALGAVHAHASNPLVGRWKVAWSDSKRHREAILIVDAGGRGSFYSAVERMDPCGGRGAPISFESMDEQSAKIRIVASSVIPGCPDELLRVRLTNPDSGVGRLGKWKVTITRQ